MKCWKCDGTGEYDIYNDCPVCDGTGEIEVTNEEWFCKLPLTEKSEFMAKAFENLLDDIENGKDVSFVKTVTFWDYLLKKVHKE